MPAPDPSGAVEARRWPGGPLVAAAAALTYVVTLWNGLVWDDAVVISGNPALLESGLSLFTGLDVNRAIEPTPFYRPLTLLTFLLEERLHGHAPLPMHLVNVLLHAAVAFLVHQLVEWLAEERATALLAGAIFAVHPIGAEAVSFLSGGRNTLLAALFAVSALLVHRRAVVEGKWALALGGATCTLAGLLSKEGAAPILAFLVALELPSLRGPTMAARQAALLRLAPHAAAVAAYLVLRQGALAGAGVEVSILPGLGERLVAAAYVIPRYLLTIAAPWLASPRYFVPERLAPLALPLGLAWAGLLAGLAWLLTRGRSRATLFGLSWLALFWLPVSSIVPFPGTPLADRYLYLPGIGLWIVLADQLVRQARRRRLPPRAVAVAAGGLVAALALLAASTSRHWHSDVSLFRWMVERAPRQAFGHHNLGTAYLDKVGDLDAAERELAIARELDPHFPKVHTQLGFVRLRRQDPWGALEHYAAALRDDPLDAEALLNSGVASEQVGDRRSAASYYRHFLATPASELPGARPMAWERLQAIERGGFP